MNDILSNNLKDELERIDVAIAKFNKDIETGKQLAALKADKNFKAIFIEGFLDSNAKELFAILTDPSGASHLTNEEVHLRLAAISLLKGFVGTDEMKSDIEISAEAAPDLITKEQQYRAEVTARYKDKEEEV